MLSALLLAACGEDESPSSTTPVDTSEAAVVVTAGVDKVQVDIGDRVRYTITVRYDPDQEVDFPAVLDQFENWVIYDAGFWVPGESRGTKETQELTLELDPGLGPVLEIPPATIRHRAPGDETWEEIVTVAITVEVTDVSEDPAEFREPVEAFELPVVKEDRAGRDRRRLFWAAGAALILIAGLAFFLLRRRREHRAPPLPPHEIAQRELAQLDALGLLERGELKQYYSRLTDILRRYIELRFGIMAPERTTDEFLVEAKRSEALRDEDKARLAEILQSADMVKFARHEPPIDDARRAFEIAEGFVKATIATPEELQSGAAS